MDGERIPALPRAELVVVGIVEPLGTRAEHTESESRPWGRALGLQVGECTCGQARSSCRGLSLQKSHGPPPGPLNFITVARIDG